MIFRKRLVSSAIAMGLCASAHAFEFTNVYILGDSLSDAGQYGSRFTTNPGLTAPEYLAQRYGFTVRPSRAAERSTRTHSMSYKAGRMTSSFTLGW
jgi:hypothetical protein